MWDQLFELDGARRRGHPGVLPRSGTVKTGRRSSLVVAGAVIVAAVVALVAWLLWPTPQPSDESASQAAQSSQAAEAQAQKALSRMVPAGYTVDSCSPVETPEAALAKVACAANDDPNGPPSATYTLVADKAALTAVFDEVVKTSTTRECPGRIQSPGPWRRNATPKLVSGILFCGLQQNRPMVAWTDEARLMLGEAHAGERGPTFPQLYAWWSAHS